MIRCGRLVLVGLGFVLLSAVSGCRSSRVVEAGGVFWTLPANWQQVTPKGNVTAIQMKRQVLVSFRRWGSMWANTSSGGRTVTWTADAAKVWQGNTLGFERSVMHADASTFTLHGTAHDSLCVTSFVSHAYTLRCVVLGTTLITHYVGSKAGMDEAQRMLAGLK